MTHLRLLARGEMRSALNHPHMHKLPYTVMPNFHRAPCGIWSQKCVNIIMVTQSNLSTIFSFSRTLESEHRRVTCRLICDGV